MIVFINNNTNVKQRQQGMIFMNVCKQTAEHER